METISLQRTYDFELIRSILTHPRLYPHISSDFHPAREEFTPNKSEAIHYMLATLDGVTLGLYMTHWCISAITWEVHHAILPTAWKYTDAIREVFERWLWTETPCRTAIGHTPACNKLACRYALRNGMKETGRIPGGYKKDGRFYDILLFAKERPNMI